MAAKALYWSLLAAWVITSLDIGNLIQNPRITRAGAVPWEHPVIRYASVIMTRESRGSSPGLFVQLLEGAEERRMSAGGRSLNQRIHP